MNWQQICENKSLQDLPFKIELNAYGKIIMSPVKVYHSAYQGKIAALLYLNTQGGEVLAECAIKTDKGTKVADVAWASDERFGQIKNEAECSVAPEICVEILSSSNTEKEMEEKRYLYFKSGAKEVWICHQNGMICVYNKKDKIEKSELAPEFPNQIDM
jgi:Uma2 family endonuclease